MTCTLSNLHLFGMSCHYLPFVLQGLKNCSEEMRADEEYMVSLWQHEVTRVVKDRICRSVDIKWFEKTLKTIIKEVQLLSKEQIFVYIFSCGTLQKTM